MKNIKKTILSFILILILPIITNAATYQFEVKVNNLSVNAISGSFKITNGQIKNITMANGWENKTNLNNEFYFSAPKILNGNYTVATVTVEGAENSYYEIKNLTYHALKCEQDKYQNYYDKIGNKVSSATYKTSCNISSNANLKSLDLSAGNLNPKFNKNITNYTVNVTNNITSLKLYGVPEDSKSKIITSSICQLNEGNNSCKITVLAEDQTTKTYIVNVVRAKKQVIPSVIDPTIKNLQVVNATLLEDFNPDIKNYNLKLDAGQNKIYFKYTEQNVEKTSPACIIASNTLKCHLTITSIDNSVKTTYTFNIIQDEKNSANSVVKPSNSNSSNSSNKTEEENNSGDNMPNIPDQNNNEEIEKEPETQTTKKSIFQKIPFKTIGIITAAILTGAIICVLISRFQHKRKFFK